MIFARQGGGRRKADALQGRQRSIAKIRPQRLSTFSQELVLARFLIFGFAENRRQLVEKPQVSKVFRQAVINS